MSDSEDEITMYEEVSEAKSIITTLVDDIYNDDSYQDYLKELETSETKGSVKKVENIKNTFSDIKVFNSNTEPLFLSQDIGIIIGTANVKAMIKNYNENEKVIGYIRIGGKILKKEFLTRYGIIRILLGNRTKLGEVFRGFIYKLLDHMVYNEIDKLKSIAREYTEENRELVADASQELSENIQHYKELYDLEYKTRIELENEQSFNEMYIEQLKLEKKRIMDKLNERKYDDSQDDTTVALEIVKKKYMKEFSIYLAKPDILNNLFTGIKSPYDGKREGYLLENYLNNYDFLVKTIELGADVNDDDIYYLTVGYGTNSIKDSIVIATDFVFDKNKFNQLVEILKTECDTYTISKTKNTASNYIFKTSVEHIKLVTRNIIL